MRTPVSNDHILPVPWVFFRKRFDCTDKIDMYCSDMCLQDLKCLLRFKIHAEYNCNRLFVPPLVNGMVCMYTVVCPSVCTYVWKIVCFKLWFINGHMLFKLRR